MFESAAGLGGSGAVDAKALRPNADRRRLIPWPRHPGGQSALDPFVDLQAGRFAGFETEFGVHPVSLRLSFSIYTPLGRFVKILFSEDSSKRIFQVSDNGVSNGSNGSNGVQQRGQTYTIQQRGQTYTIHFSLTCSPSGEDNFSSFLKRIRGWIPARVNCRAYDTTPLAAF